MLPLSEGCSWSASDLDVPKLSAAYVSSPVDPATNRLRHGGGNAYSALSFWEEEHALVLAKGEAPPALRSLNRWRGCGLGFGGGRSRCPVMYPTAVNEQETGG